MVANNDAAVVVRTTAGLGECVQLAMPRIRKEARWLWIALAGFRIASLISAARDLVAVWYSAVGQVIEPVTQRRRYADSELGAGGLIAGGIRPVGLLCGK